MSIHARGYFAVAGFWSFIVLLFLYPDIAFGMLLVAGVLFVSCVVFGLATGGE